jgi:hypothetical protein
MLSVHWCGMPDSPSILRLLPLPLCADHSWNGLKGRRGSDSEAELSSLCCHRSPWRVCSTSSNRCPRPRDNSDGNGWAQPLSDGRCQSSSWGQAGGRWHAQSFSPQQLGMATLKQVHSSQQWWMRESVGPRAGRPSVDSGRGCKPATLH